jgi:hypothetical protein
VGTYALFLNVSRRSRGRVTIYIAHPREAGQAINLTSLVRNPRFSFGGEGEIDSGHPGPRPTGALRASKIAPRDFVELTSFDLAERVRLTRAILALALRARYARPKSLPAILSNSVSSSTHPAPFN